MRRTVQRIKEFLGRPLVAGLLTFVVLRIVMTPLIQPTVCADGWPSGSIGRRGACSHHHGIGTNWSLLGVLIGSGLGGLAVGRMLVAAEQRKWAALNRQRDVERAEANVRRYSQMPKSPTTPACPICGASMRERIATRGRSAGGKFWGCSNYPRCRGTRSAGLN